MEEGDEGRKQGVFMLVEEGDQSRESITRRTELGRLLYLWFSSSVSLVNGSG